MYPHIVGPSLIVAFITHYESKSGNGYMWFVYDILVFSYSWKLSMSRVGDEFHAMGEENGNSTVILVAPKDYYREENSFIFLAVLVRRM